MNIIFIALDIYLWWCVIQSQRHLNYRSKLGEEIRGIVRMDVAIGFYDEIIKVGFWEAYFQPWKPFKNYYSKELQKLNE